MDNHTLPGQQMDAIALEVLASGQSIRYQARGHSMRPVITDGDILEVRSIHSNPIRLGDVVIFRHENSQLLVHRIVRTRLTQEQWHYLLQGDALLRPDGWITQASILGKVVALDHDGQWQRMDSLSRRFIALLVALFLPGIKDLYQLLRKIILMYNTHHRKAVL